jgi:hypothetical protein
VGRYVVGSLTIIGTFGEPSLDGFAVCRRVVVVSALEAESAQKHTHDKNKIKLFLNLQKL